METAAYKNPKIPVEERVKDLLSRMTLEEKAGQLLQVDGRRDAEKWIRERYIGSFLHFMGEGVTRLQKMAMETRLGIPLLFGIDAVHGNAFWPGATIFPSQLGLASSFNPDLVERMGRATAIEVALSGVHWTFSPILCLARDLRWGRIDETFGEDPYLIGELAKAMIKGYQQDNLADDSSILACAKHFAGYSETSGGRDSSEADLSRRKLLSTFLPPFKEAAKAGCATFMAGYQSIDGIPCSLNKWLLSTTLKEEWGFEGFVVSDWDNIGRSVNQQFVCATIAEASVKAVNAGNDMAMCTSGFLEAVIQAAGNGQIRMETIDDACRRILRVKFKLGLFDNEKKLYPDIPEAIKVIGCKEHRKTAFECACQSLVLLKNSPTVLPIGESVKRIAVVGPNADDVHNQLGDWSHPRGIDLGSGIKEHNRKTVTTVLDGLFARAPSSVQIAHCKACNVLDDGYDEIATARELALNSDLVVCVIGDTLSQVGELKDRANLDLSGKQEALVKEMHKTGKPIVVILINSKPLTIPWVAQNASAIVEAWNPGMEGGNAIAALLFGDINPSGKLAISFPCHVGQQPVYYNQIPGWHSSKYVDMPKEPLFAFGFGMSYTSFDYMGMSLSQAQLKAGETLTVKVRIKNSGSREGTEVVQVYINDVVSSLTTAVKQLKAFTRVTLKSQEMRVVELTLPYEAFSLIDENLNKVVEPGEFIIMAGSSSRDSDLLRKSVTAI